MFDQDLQTAANIAEMIGSLSIAAAIVFGTFQLREFRRRRRDTVATELMRSFYSADLAGAVTLLRTLPDGISASKLREHGPEYERAAVLATTTFETMGLLVFRRIAPFSLVEELAGGMTVMIWRKVSRWLEVVREEQSQPSWAEWFHWLAERMLEVKMEREPAHVRHRNWRR
jgi:hypothetical protein